MAKIKNPQKDQFGAYGVIAGDSIKSDRLVLLIFFFSLVSIIIQAVLILGSWGKLPPQVPLYYSKPWGEAMLASPRGLWLLPTIVLITLTVNFFIAIFLVSDNKFLVWTLVIFCFLVSLTTLYDTLKIIILLI